MEHEAGPRRSPWSASVALAILLAILALGLASSGVRANPPTLTILSPVDGAVIGNGTPVTVIFVTSEFNLTEPGTGGGNANEGHVQVYVNGSLYALTSKPTVDLPLPSGTHEISLRLVSDNGTGLSPEVNASVTVTVTRGPAVGTPQINITYLATDYPNPGVVFDEDVTISFAVTDFALVPPGKGIRVPREGHIVVFLDGVVNRRVTTYTPIPFADLEDGEHNVTLQLVDSAGLALNPDASDSVTFRTQPQAVVDINPYLSIAQIVLGLAILGVLFYRGPGPAVIIGLYNRIRGRRP
jgi:hypothetical protein